MNYEPPCVSLVIAPLAAALKPGGRKADGGGGGGEGDGTGRDGLLPNERERERTRNRDALTGRKACERKERERDERSAS